MMAGAPSPAVAEPAGAFTVTAFDSLHTFREDAPPEGGQASVALSAARGETESFQVVVTNRSQDELREVRVTLAGLPGVESTLYAAGSILLEKPGKSGGAPAGRYFDLLRPAGWETISPGAHRPYWVDLRVPAQGMRAGVHQGSLVVSAGGARQSLPVTLRVRGFRLPAVPSLKMAFAFVPVWMEQYYGRRLSPEELRSAQDVMLDHRLGPVAMWGGGPELFQEEALRHCLERGQNVVLLSCGGATDEAIRRSLDALAPKIETLKRLGALDRTYLFGFDEITMSHPELIPAMRKAYEGFRAQYPGIRRVNTSHPDDRLRDFVDIFVVPVSQFLPAMAKERETWWYSVGADNLGTELDFRLDFPAVVHRAFFLADWKAGVTGHLYWAVQREWPGNKDVPDKARPESAWRPGYENVNSKRWVQDNGGGNLFYPDGAGSMLPSVRVKRVRDGIEDYEYLAQLRSAAGDLARAKPRGWQELARDAAALLAVPDALVQVGGGWSEGWSVEGDAAACSLTTHPRAIHGGKQALRVLPALVETSVFRDAPAAPKGKYQVSGWIKTDDLTGAARLKAEYRDAKGTALLSRESDAVSGNSGKFVEVAVEMPPAPAGTAGLRVRLCAVAAAIQTTPDAPLQKAFFDDIRVTRDNTELPIPNSSFEAERLRVGTDPQPLLQYRERLAECLERCMNALAR